MNTHPIGWMAASELLCQILGNYESGTGESHDRRGPYYHGGYAWAHNFGATARVVVGNETDMNDDRGDFECDRIVGLPVWPCFSSPGVLWKLIRGLLPVEAGSFEGDRLICLAVIFGVPFQALRLFEILNRLSRHAEFALCPKCDGFDWEQKGGIGAIMIRDKSLGVEAVLLGVAQ